MILPKCALEIERCRLFTYEFQSEVFLWKGKAAWHFITLPPDLGAEINRHCKHLKAGWGSIKVTVRIGSTEWRTSIFPDKKSGSYLLPLNAKVRSAEQLSAGQSPIVELTI